MGDDSKNSRNPANSGSLAGVMQEVLPKFLEAVDGMLPAVVVQPLRVVDDDQVRAVAAARLNGATQGCTHAAAPLLGVWRRDLRVRTRKLEQLAYTRRPVRRWKAELAEGRLHRGHIRLVVDVHTQERLEELAREAERERAAVGGAREFMHLEDAGIGALRDLEAQPALPNAGRADDPHPPSLIHT